MADEDEEKLAREQLGNMMVHAIKHKKENIEAIFDYMAFAEKTAKGLPHFVEAIASGKTNNEQLGHMVRVLSTTAAKQAEAIRQMGVFLMIYVSSDTFSGDAASAANRLGKGDEGLRAFFQSKFGGALGKKG